MNRTQSQINGMFCLELMGHMLSDNQWDGFVHQHDFDELIYVMKGPIICRCREQSVRLNKGELLLFSANVDHCITADEPSSFLYIGFKTNLADVTPYTMQPLSDENPYIMLLKTQLDEIAQKVFWGEGSFSDFTPQIMSAILPFINDLCESKITQNSKSILSDQIKQYIKQHLHQSIRVDDIAAGLYHTPHYLGNVFSTVNGMTIKEYVMQLKMQKAFLLLQNKSLSIAKVAELLGFESAHYFSKCFKKYYGFLPSNLKGRM